MVATSSTVKISPNVDVMKEPSSYPFYAADVVSGVGASLLVSPSITILDRSITLKASGAMKVCDCVRVRLPYKPFTEDAAKYIPIRYCSPPVYRGISNIEMALTAESPPRIAAVVLNGSLGNGCSCLIREGVKELVFKPHVFYRRPEFLMIWGVYAATYVAANMIVTTCEMNQVDDTWPKLIGTTFVNITSCVAKDLEFVRMFATGKSKPVPVPTCLLFTARDGMTVAASFNMPGPVSKYLQDRLGMSQKNADVTAQLACPTGIQLLSTPLNLLGLDLYNNPKSNFTARMKFIASDYTSSMIMQVSRTGPAFGIGGLGNTTFRQYFSSLFAS